MREAARVVGDGRAGEGCPPRSSPRTTSLCAACGGGGGNRPVKPSDPLARQIVIAVISRLMTILTSLTRPLGRTVHRPRRRGGSAMSPDGSIGAGPDPAGSPDATDEHWAQYAEYLDGKGRMAGRASAGCWSSANDRAMLIDAGIGPPRCGIRPRTQTHRRRPSWTASPKLGRTPREIESHRRPPTCTWTTSGWAAQPAFRARGTCCSPSRSGPGAPPLSKTPRRRRR